MGLRILKCNSKRILGGLSFFVRDVSCEKRSEAFFFEIYSREVWRAAACLIGLYSALTELLACKRQVVVDSVSSMRRDAERKLFGYPNAFSGLGIATISALLQIFRILSWRKEVSKSQN